MSPQRLYDKYGTYTLQPDQVRRDAELITLMETNGVNGTVFHMLTHIPEQGEDIYTVLVDDRSVVTFEVPRTTGTRTAEEFRTSPLTHYRNEVGQGKRRMRLDRAVEDARKLLVK